VAPENTLASFQRAIEDGADGVEFDVRLSRDGVPVVIHDASLRRTGLRKGAIAELPASELAEVDVGTWFNRVHPRLRCEQYERERVCLLDDVLGFFKIGGRARARLYVELKSDKAEATRAELSYAVVRTVLAHRLAQRVVLLSFDLGMLTEVKRMKSSLSIGVLVSPRLRGRRTLVEKAISMAVRIGASEVGLHYLLATQRNVRLAHENNLCVFVWTVNHPRWIARARRLGVDAIITDNPAKMLAARVDCAGPRSGSRFR
jgi:glycerophosphoryl diester phosphodiesterase